MKVKYIIYLKGMDRGIVLTDEEKGAIDVKTKEFSNLMHESKIGSIKTKNDCLVIRSSDIVGIHIVSIDGSFESMDITHESTEAPDIPDVVTELDLGGDEPEPEPMIKESKTPKSIMEKVSSTPKFSKFSDFRKKPNDPKLERDIPEEILREAEKINESDEF